VVWTAPTVSGSERALVRQAGLPALLGASLASLRRPGWQITCRCTDDQELRDLSRRFLGEDHPTDVLAFALGDPGRARPAGGQRAVAPMLGDLAISVERAAAQAEAARVSPVDELRMLAVHGLLHLCGHDHDTPPRAAAMTRATRALLRADACRHGAQAPAVPELVPSPAGPA